MLLRYLPKKMDVPFMSARWPAFALSAALLIASIVLVSIRGLNFGIDFAGGSVIEITQPEDAGVAEVRSALGGLDLGDIQINAARGTGVDASTVIVIRVRTQPATEALTAEEAQQAATDLVENTLANAFGEIDVRSRSSVGPKVSGELLQAGVTALVVALALMLAYIWFRFEWQFSLGAVAALTHDVVLTIGVFSALQLEFNLSTVAALLTIIGYSMNDTVVVFDRVREEMRRYKKLPLGKVVDIALNGTLSRTLITSGTTLLALLAIFFLGGPVLRGMSFALIWGVLVGTYSSIFIASSILLTIGISREPRKVEDAPGFQSAP